MAIFVGHPWSESIPGTTGDDLFVMGSGGRQFGGDDTVTGSLGNDVFDFDASFTGTDVVDGGVGTDTLRLSGNYAFGALTLENLSSVEIVELSGRKSFLLGVEDAAVAAGGNLTIDGRRVSASGHIDAQSDTLQHATLTLYGGKGSDTLSGGSLGDTLNGGLGSDILTGDRAGSDVAGSADLFVYRGPEETTVAAPDHVYWDPRAGDRIDLHRIDADAATPGNQRFDFIGTDAFSQTAGELRYRPSLGGYLISGDIDGDGIADFAIQASANNIALPGALIGHDFVL